MKTIIELEDELRNKYFKNISEEFIISGIEELLVSFPDSDKFVGDKSLKSLKEKLISEIHDYIQKSPEIKKSIQEINQKLGIDNLNEYSVSLDIGLLETDKKLLDGIRFQIEVGENEIPIIYGY